MGGAASGGGGGGVADRRGAGRRQAFGCVWLGLVDPKSGKTEVMSTATRELKDEIGREIGREIGEDIDSEGELMLTQAWRALLKRW